MPTRSYWRSSAVVITARSVASISGVVHRCSSTWTATTRPSARRITSEVRSPAGTASGITCSEARNASARSTIWSMVPPAGRRAATAWRISRRPKLAARAVNPVGLAICAKNASASGVPGTGTAVRPWPQSSAAKAVSSSPSASARARHSDSRLSVGTSCLRPRVAYVARCAARAPLSPRSSMCISISWRRRENARNTGFGMPSISAMPFVTGVQPRPNRWVSSARSCASYRCPTVLAHPYSDRASSADQRPSSAHQTRFATRTCVWRCGSPARDVRCRNAAETNPSATCRSAPPRPRRARAASPSNTRSAAATAASCALRTSFDASASPSANSSDTDFGAQNVASNPGIFGAPCARVNRSPVVGSRDSNTSRNASGSTSPARPRRAALRPVHSPGASFAPV